MPQSNSLDFSWQNLRNRSFKNQNLTGANFTGSDLRGCDFSDAILRGANFQQVIIGRSNKQIIIKITSYLGSCLIFLLGGITIIVFAKAYNIKEIFDSGVLIFLIGILSIFVAFIDGLWMSKISFKNSDLTSSNFSKSNIQDADFSEAILSYVNWTEAHLVHCKFPYKFSHPLVIQLCTKRTGKNQDFRGFDLRFLDLNGVNLSNTNLIGADLTLAILCYANLQNTNLSWSTAKGTDFSGAIFTGACIMHWGINSETNFSEAQCDWIYLECNLNDLSSTYRERKPISGFFNSGDFAKLVHQFTLTLEFLLHNGIEPKAFDFALKNLLKNYYQAGISIHSIVDVGDGDRIVRLNIADPNADKVEIYRHFLQDYESMQK